MELVCVQNEALPRLAWCARLDGDTAVIKHGAWVESSDVGFVEGAWDGVFSEWDFKSAKTLSGSGGILYGEGMMFSSPTHILEHLYAVSVGKQLFVSNSLVYVLSEIDDELDPAYCHYIHDLLNALVIDSKGTNTSLRTQQGHVIHLFTSCNVLVDSKLKWWRLQKTIGEAPRDYASYRSMLSKTTRLLCANAADASRTQVFAPLTTISSGYDSPACAVLAAEVGCHDAITFVNSKEECAGGTDDSGTEIGRKLGLSVVERDRNEYLSLDSSPEIEFAACGGLHDVVMAPLASDFEKRVVFGGVHGDVIWSDESRQITTDLQRQELLGVSWSEFRLRTGFIHFAMPLVEATMHPAVYMITHSDEMKPWNVDGWYNRPIPRRIVEEAGIPREWFGVGKKAVTVDQAFSKSFDEFLLPESRESFKAFCKQVPLVRRMRYRLQRFGFAVGYRFAKFRRALWQWLDRSCRGKPLLWRLREKYDFGKRGSGYFNARRYFLPQPPADLLFLWGMSHMIERYKAALQSDGINNKNSDSIAKETPTQAVTC